MEVKYRPCGYTPALFVNHTLLEWGMCRVFFEVIYRPCGYTPALFVNRTLLVRVVCGAYIKLFTARVATHRLRMLLL